VAARIAYFRKKAGLRPSKLADALGVTRGTVSQWESDYSRPSYENLARVCEACGVTMREFWAAEIVVVDSAARR